MISLSLFVSSQQSCKVSEARSTLWKSDRNVLNMHTPLEIKKKLTVELYRFCLPPQIKSCFEPGQLSNVGLVYHMIPPSLLSLFLPRGVYFDMHSHKLQSFPK